MALSKVITFGAPQVIAPNYDNAVWQHLNRIAIQYVNDFDAVPRLPCCVTWLDDLLPRVASCNAAHVGVSIEVPSALKIASLKQSLAVASEYDVVGALVMITAGCRKAKRLQSSRDGD